MVNLTVLTQAISNLDEDVLNRIVYEVLSKNDKSAEVQEVLRAFLQGMMFVG